MQQAGFTGGAGTFRDWAFISTADPHFGVYFSAGAAARQAPAQRPARLAPSAVRRDLLAAVCHVAK
jgi:hypothetical protein